MTSPSPPTPLSSTQPLTTQLLSLYNQDLKTATQTPFLEQAGRGTLPKAVLEKWLCEDRFVRSFPFFFPPSYLSQPRSRISNLMPVSLEQIGRIPTDSKIRDRIYAHAYLKFAAQLLAGIATHLPRKVDAGDIYERIADVVVEALVAIRRELGMFADIAREYKLNISDNAEVV
ncbi:uncharacterized protein LY89DRAFT_450211 [Mollisia scopiformis]|uniref:Uncharacterized protein n=1 Tax=Mollisia scopiformis TaxID=149040 RepID=A0A194XKG8_MOLSC|nr:uncharacterized protein LY89DRAFT_450211 [Mollisia scopiformis]KUJ20636.1 hypothetical protein LY89DRAFT_450211 [Mollisia scopiformis]